MQSNQKVIQHPAITFEDIIKQIGDCGLSTTCNTINKFNSLMDDDNVSSKNKDLESLIKKDISFATEVLKIANSPLYRSKNSQGIESISNAINIIGWDSIYKTGMFLAVKGFLNSTRTQSFSKWMVNRAIAIATISEIFLTSLKSFNNNFSDIRSIYAYGLTHDIGSLAMLQVIDNYQQDIVGVKLSNQTNNWSDAEQSLYGFDHSMVGEQLLIESQLPRSFSIVARYHHTPSPKRYSVTDSRKITLIRLAQAALVDKLKFSMHDAYSEFNIIKEDGMLREYDDFSESMRQELEEQLGLTPERYNEIKSTNLTDDYINTISQQF